MNTDTDELWKEVQRIIATTKVRQKTLRNETATYVVDVREVIKILKQEFDITKKKP